MSFAANGTSYHPHVYLSAGGPYYQLDVYTDCAGSALACGNEPGRTSVGNTNWETNNTGEMPLYQSGGPVLGTVSGQFTNAYVNFFSLNMIYRFGIE